MRKRKGLETTMAMTTFVNKFKDVKDDQAK